MVAHHWLQAAAGGAAVTGAGPAPAPAAVDWSRRAAEEAADGVAHEQAVAHLADALAVLDAEPEAGDRVAVLLALADARLAAGDQPGSRVALLEAAAGARARGDRASLVRVALGLGGAGFEVPAADAPAIDLLREALDALDPADPTGAGTRALLLSRLSVSLSYGVPVAERQELSATAVALALGLG